MVNSTEVLPNTGSDNMKFLLFDICASQEQDTIILFDVHNIGTYENLSVPLKCTRHRTLRQMFYVSAKTHIRFDCSGLSSMSSHSFLVLFVQLLRYVSEMKGYGKLHVK